MAIKDLVAPGFVGTSSIKFIVTRGMLGAPAPIGTGAWSFKSEDFSVPKFIIENMHTPSFGVGATSLEDDTQTRGEDMSVPKFIIESLKRS